MNWSVRKAAVALLVVAVLVGGMWSGTAAVWAK
jgi:hypothetical protein